MNKSEITYPSPSLPINERAHKEQATSCQRINQATKALSFTIRYLKSNVIEGKSTFIIPRNEIETINEVCQDYSVPVSPMRDRENSEMKEAHFLEQQNSTGIWVYVPTIDELSPLYCLERIDSPLFHQQIKESIMELSQEKDKLYFIKEAALRCAYCLGEIRYKEPCKTDKGIWVDSLVWDNITFHLYASAENSIRYENMYGMNYHSYKKQRLRYCGREKLTESINILEKYIKENARPSV